MAVTTWAVYMPVIRSFASSSRVGVAIATAAAVATSFTGVTLMVTSNIAGSFSKSVPICATVTDTVWVSDRVPGASMSTAASGVTTRSRSVPES